MGGQRFVMGCCLTLKHALTIEGIVTAIGHLPRGATLLVVSDFNADLI